MNRKYKDNFIQAGKLAKEVRSFGKALIQRGASYFDIVAKINRKIEELGARPAFPPQIALNHVAAHFLPLPGEDIILFDEMVKLDIGVSYHGAIGDCAVSVDLSGRNQSLIDAVENALLNAEKSLRIGQPISEIGKIIEETITSFGYNPVRNLSGHGLGEYQIHTSPGIPNYEDRSKATIKPGMTFAIEPFATDGKGMIFESGEAMIFGFLSSRPIRSDLARGVLTKIRNYHGLPFAMHDLVCEEFPLSQVKSALEELIKLGVIAGYPPLVEEKNRIVAQAENSVLIDEQGQILITTR